MTQRRSSFGRRLQQVVGELAAAASARRGPGRRPRTRARRRRGRAACRRGRSARRRRCAPRRGGRRPRGATEIASSKSLAVSGSIVNVTRSRRSTRPSRTASARRCGSSSAREALLLDEERLEHVSIRPAGPSTRRRACRGLATTARSPAVTDFGRDERRRARRTARRRRASRASTRDTSRLDAGREDTAHRRRAGRVGADLDDDPARHEVRPGGSGAA